MPFLTLTRGTHHSLHPLTLDGRNDKTSYIYIHSKADVSQLNLPLRTKNITQKKRKRNWNKNRYAQNKRSSQESVESVLGEEKDSGGKD